MRTRTEVTARACVSLAGEVRSFKKVVMSRSYPYLGRIKVYEPREIDHSFKMRDIPVREIYLIVKKRPFHR